VTTDHRPGGAIPAGPPGVLIAWSPRFQLFAGGYDRVMVWDLRQHPL
jgi:hypothetical protein